MGDRVQDSSEPLVVLNDEGTVVELNDAAARALGATGAQLVGKNFASLRAQRELESVGHGLRNPLAAMLTALELMDLKDRFLFQRERDVLSRQTRHLIHLVDNLLDVGTNTESPPSPPIATRLQEPVLARLGRKAGRTRVLIVDDNADAAEMLKEALEGAGFIVRTVYDGPDALRAARDFQPGVAVLDLGLPAMNGYELASQLRSQPGLSDLYLVALTGYGQPSDRLETSKAGFSAHLVKPINLDRLIKALEP